ncbi:MAG: PaaI family thioesterase [Alphaproteobacteria bacterium]|nr:PaaI family thioesterase [Alphaproteobacteria bacterium]
MSDVGFRKWLGLTYEVMADDHAVVSLELDEDKRNVRDVAHGGIVASLVDVAMGTAAAGGNYATRQRYVVTLELKVNYLAPARGTKLTATARVIRGGARTFVVECRVVTDLGEECAMALGTFITRRRTDQDAEREAQGLPR